MPSSPQPNNGPASGSVAREALKFLISPEGSFFRDFLMTEIVQSIDALSRKQVHLSLHPLSQKLKIAVALLPRVYQVQGIECRSRK
jgi:aarF domain-containing kinase